jgi:two-component system, chemotaxis family, protein-glutamate methylesterase/glutaminase
MIKLLIVDDSALMRRHLVQLFEKEQDFRTLAVRNGQEALEALEEFNPDVITLDINMPVMDGLTCLSRIMVQRPKPVVMVSSLTEAGAEATFEALQLGAVDFIHKPGGTISRDIIRIEHGLIMKVRAAATAKVRRSRGLTSRLAERRDTRALPVGKALPPLSRDKVGIVLVGVSTGGPGTLEDILPQLPAGFPWPVVIAQHMPSSFTGVFARRLASLCQVPVSEVARQTVIEPGNVYVARGDADLVFTNTGLGLMALPAPASAQHLWHPSVTRMVESAMSVMPPERLIGVQLTGMGDDGAKAMTNLRSRGGRTIAQDEASCVVFGMPGELVRMGGADVVLPARGIPNQLLSWLAPATATRTSMEARYGSR